MITRKRLAVAFGVLGLLIVGCEEKKASPPAMKPPATPKAPSGAPGATVPTTPPPAPK